MGTIVAGSPAHAGIDPHGQVDLSHLCGFPRTRGDRPLRNPRRVLVVWVPPHRRG